MGALGVLFVFVGPILIGVAYWQWVEYIKTIMAQPYLPFDPPGSTLLPALAGSFMSLASFPMMIIGREFTGTTLVNAGRVEPS